MITIKTFRYLTLVISINDFIQAIENKFNYTYKSLNDIIVESMVKTINLPDLKICLYMNEFVFQVSTGYILYNFIHWYKDHK